MLRCHSDGEQNEEQTTFAGVCLPCTLLVKAIIHWSTASQPSIVTICHIQWQIWQIGTMPDIRQYGQHLHTHSPPFCVIS